MKIKRWIQDGHGALSCSGVNTEADLIEAAGAALDSACSWDIMGEVMFEGEDGKIYVGCVEFIISEANPEYAKEKIAEMELESE
jgi:hypothetical protein